MSQDENTLLPWESNTHDRSFDADSGKTANADISQYDIECIKILSAAKQQSRISYIANAIRQSIQADVDALIEKIGMDGVRRHYSQILLKEEEKQEKKVARAKKKAQQQQ
mgnify:CR=1 FL=1